MSVEFIDSNVLIYAYSAQAGPPHTQASELLFRLVEEDTGALSTQVLSEFFSVMTGKLRMKSEYAEQAIEKLTLWPCHRPGYADVMNSIRLQRRYKFSWWDAMIVNSAIESQASVLWTEDLNDGQRVGSLTIRNPFKSLRA